MNKLETLKDIVKYYDLGGEILSRIEHPEIKGMEIIVSEAQENRKLFLNNLRATAIKWAKHYIEMKKKLDKIDTDYGRGKMDGALEFIIDKFNLTREDLK